jgi:thiamine pyrophosphokinase
MDALLFTGGEAPERMEALLQGKPFVCAADSGLAVARRWRLDPDLVAGDMDSLENASLLDSVPKDRIIVFPKDKDETDTEIGLRLLFERGYKEVALIGGGGGRLDHLIALLALFERPLRPRLWLTARERIDIVDKEFYFSAGIGETVSAFPLGGGRTSAWSEGLKWELGGLEWDRGGFGISNEAKAEIVRIRVLSGALMIVRNLARIEGRPS